jgi:hypothetical protein
MTRISLLRRRCSSVSALVRSALIR